MITARATRIVDYDAPDETQPADELELRPRPADDRMKRAAQALALLAACASGCSFFMVDRYRAPKPPLAASTCTTSHKWTLVDAAVAVLAYGTSFYLSRYGGAEVPAYTGNAVGGIGVGFGVSAGYGLWNVQHCRQELAAHAAEPAAEPAPVAEPAAPAPEAPAAAEPPPPEPVTAIEEPAAAEKPRAPTRKHKSKKKKRK